MVWAYIIPHSCHELSEAAPQYSPTNSMSSSGHDAVGRDEFWLAKTSAGNSIAIKIYNFIFFKGKES